MRKIINWINQYIRNYRRDYDLRRGYRITPGGSTVYVKDKVKAREKAIQIAKNIRGINNETEKIFKTR